MIQPALSSISIRFLACSLAVVTTYTFTGFGVHGRTIRLNWTAEGVRNFTSTPLRVELGDMLELVCDENISNLFIQPDRIQYNSCNASVGSGVFKYNGLCFPNNPAMLTLTENSKPLDNTVNFMNNQTYFLTSYSDGEFRANDATFTSGGQCEDGLRIIIVIGDIEVPTSGGNSGGTQQGPGPPSSEGLDTGNKSGSSTTNVYIIVGAVVGGLILVGLFITAIIITVVCVIKGRRSKEGKTTSHGNSSYYLNNNFNRGTDSQSCTLTRAAEIDYNVYNVESRPVVEISIPETTVTVPQANDEVNKPLTFCGKKRVGSADFLNENSHYRSAEKSFDDATGQMSTPFHGSTTPEHLLKAKSASELTSLPGTLPTRKPKPIPPKKPRQQDRYKSSSADNLIS